eukprot:TRINITY_DN2055_c0_g1_i3.p2 TRINITY_DN2055_c0_g1~~TRINITY_DN2055_c0_g1_i3.p2  ORF type:complete len:133 (-),score=16.93 TRINITY_DN2055_c0_g1_i3:38-436(-)
MVPTQQAKIYCDEHKLLFYETSAKYATNVEEAFTGALRETYLRIVEPERRSFILSCHVAVLLAHHRRAGWRSPLRVLPTFILQQILQQVLWDTIAMPKRTASPKKSEAQLAPPHQTPPLRSPSWWRLACSLV